MNHEIIPLDPTTGPKQAIVLPGTAPVDAEDAHRPPSLRGLWGVDALACSPSRLAVGLNNATEALLLDRKSGQIDRVALPPVAEVESVAFNDGGTAAFALQDYNRHGPHTVLLVGSSHTTTQSLTVADSSRILASGAHFLVGAHPQVLTLDQNGKATVAGPTTPVGAPTPSVVLSSGRFAEADPNGGIVLFDPTGKGATRKISLGTMPCNAGYVGGPYTVSGSPGPSTTNHPGGTTCGILATKLTAGPNDTVAFVPWNRQNTVMLETAPG